MQRSTVNLNDPPPRFARHRALLDEARELVVEALRRLGPDVELDDVVVVVKEPALAAERGETRVSARSLDAVLAKMCAPNRRADLQKAPPSGFVRVALFTRRDFALLTMRVRPADAVTVS